MQTHLINQILLIFTWFNKSLEGKLRFIENKLANTTFDDLEKVYEEVFLPEIKDFFGLVYEQIERKDFDFEQRIEEAKAKIAGFKPENKYDEIIFSFYEIYLNQSSLHSLTKHIDDGLLDELFESMFRFMFYLFLTKIMFEKQDKFTREQKEFVYDRLKFFAERTLAFFSLLGAVDIYPENSQFERNVYIHRSILEQQYNLTEMHNFSSIDDLLK